MIDLTRNEAQIRKNAAHCRERNIRLPTFREMKNPENISGAIRDAMGHAPPQPLSCQLEE